MVRFGIVGTGFRSQKFYEANRYTGEFELTAVYSRSMDTAKQFAFRKGKLALYDDLDAFADSDAYDAVYIASPTCCHKEQTMRLLNAGKHVLVETPMAMTEDDAKELFQLAKEKELVLMEGACSIYNPSFEKMMPYIQTLGKVRRATFSVCHPAAYDNYKRGLIGNAFRPEISGGSVMNCAVSAVSCMVRLFGRPEQVMAVNLPLGSGEDQVDGEGTILLKYPEMIAEILHSQITSSAVPSQIQGEEGSMVITEIDNIKDLHIRRRTVNQTIHFEQSDNILNYETVRFIERIHGGKGKKKAMACTLDTLWVLEQARGQRKEELNTNGEKAQPEELNTNDEMVKPEEMKKDDEKVKLEELSTNDEKAQPEELSVNDAKDGE